MEIFPHSFNVMSLEGQLAQYVSPSLSGSNGSVETVTGFPLTPPAGLSCGLSADLHLAHTAWRCGKRESLTSSLSDRWNPVPADIHPLESRPSSQNCWALRANSQYWVRFIESASNWTVSYVPLPVNLSARQEQKVPIRGINDCPRQWLTWIAKSLTWQNTEVKTNHRGSI